MTVHKNKTATGLIRDFWGSPEDGKLLADLLVQKFGDERGARKAAMQYLGVSRRLLSMYLTGERHIPDHIIELLDVHADKYEDDEDDEEIDLSFLD